ncbi:MAG: hypothetical protein NZ108_00510 [Bacteroidia bacterium]|nr:hypothetical protein [Bacteroidia bacterium]
MLRSLFWSCCLSLSIPFLQAQDMEVYKLALKYGDYHVAAHVLYEKMAKEPQNPAWKDSLASLYFTNGAYNQAILLGNELLTLDPTNRKFLEMVAISETSLGRNKDALSTYEKLYAQTKSVFHLYQIASLQYRLTRLGECNASLDVLENHPDSDKERVGIIANQGFRQDVPIKAAVFNMRGVMAMDVKKLTEAKSWFEKALQVMPEFALAKLNLETVKKDLAKPQGK